MGKFFSRLNPHVQAVSGWLGVAGVVMSTFYALLSRGVALFGNQTWQESIFIGIGLTLATGLACSILLLAGAYAFRLVRPLPSSPASSDEQSEPPAGPVEFLPREVFEREMERSDSRVGSLTSELFDRLKKLDGKVETIAALSLESGKMRDEMGNLLRDQIGQIDERFSQAVLNFGVRLTQLEDASGVHEFQAKMEAWVGNLQDAIRRGHRNIDQGFAAIFDRERLLELAAEIETVGDELSGPTNGEPLEDRSAWSAKFGEWNKKVEAWARLGATYRDGVVERVFDTPRSEYKGTWKATDDLFPDSNAVHDYKTFRIISRNFHVERSHVENCVRLTAFARPSMKGRVELGDD